MKRRLPIVVLSLISAGSLGAAAYLWNAQRALVRENAALRARFVTTSESAPAPPPKPANTTASKSPDEKDPAATAGNRPPARSPEEEARRKEFESKMTALRDKESQTRRQARISTARS